MTAPLTPARLMPLFAVLLILCAVLPACAQSWGMQDAGIGHVVGSAAADGGWQVLSNQGPGFLQYGPYTTQIAPGAHVASWQLMVDNNTPTTDPGPILRLDVSDYDAPAGSNPVLASRDVSRSQWTAANQYQTFTLPFTLPASAAGHRIEMRVYFNGYSNGYSSVREQSVAVDTGSTVYTGTPYNGPHALPGTVQCEDYDQGGEGVAYHDSDAGNNGGAYRSQDVDIEACGDSGGGYDVGWTAAGEWLRYTVQVQSAGAYTVGFRVASPGGGGSLHLEDETGANLTGAVSVPATGGWQAYTTVTASATLAAGTHVLRLYEDTSGYNLNWMSFTASSVNPDFGLSLGQSALTLAQGDSRGVPLTITTSGGFAGPVSLSVSGVPPASQSAFMPSTLTGGGTSRLILTAAPATGDPGVVPPGTYPLTVTATAGAVTRQQTLMLTVTALNYEKRSQLVLTDAGTAAGFRLTTFATGFPSTEPQVGYGPMGIAFPGTGVLVSDLIAGNVRLFPTDADGQDAGAAAVAPDGYSSPAGLATSGGLTYLCEYGNGDILRLDGSGHSLGTVAAGIARPLGVIPDPLDGHLFVTGSDGIYDVDPTAHDVDPTAGAASAASVWLPDLNGLDGLTISGDGSVLYSLNGADDIIGYDTTTKAIVFDLKAVNPQALNPIAPIVQADGTALGSGSLSGKLYVNSNDGVVWQVDMTTGDCVQVAVGGTRGDFATPDPTNGSLLLTQSTTIMRLTPPSGGRFGQTPSAPLGLRATPGNGQVSLAWNPVPGAPGYTLWRGTAPGTERNSPPVATNITGLTYTDAGLTDGQTYYYVLSAANSFGTGPTSNEASATPDGGLPAPVNAAAFVSQSVPSSMSAGQGYPVTVTLRNTGTSVWTAAGLYRLGSQAPQDNSTWGLGRVALPGTPPGPVQPGATAAFTFNVTAPPVPGSYAFQWRMVQENVQWFGDFTPQVGVAVNPPSFQIIGVSNGDALTGDVMMTVAINGPTPDYSMTPAFLNLQIDGTGVDVGALDPLSATSSARTVTFDVHTPEYANGAHSITVTDNGGASDTRAVTFANVIQNLSAGAMFDGQPLLISATMDSPQPWQVLVKDATGNTVKTIQGSGPAISVSWDGTDDQGNPIPDGYYQAMISAGDPGPAAAGAVVTPHVFGPGSAITIDRGFDKTLRGDVLVVLDNDLLDSIDPATGLTNQVAYPNYINSKLLPHVGGDFLSAPTILQFSEKYSSTEYKAAVAAEIKSILAGSYLRFLYVNAHGEDHSVYSAIHSDLSVPYFRVGVDFFYSVYPRDGRVFQVGNRSEHDYVVADHVSAAYASGDFDAPFVWMDTCCSAGSNGHGDPLTFLPDYKPYPDYSWANTFSIGIFNGGGFLGWMGYAPAYGQTKTEISESGFSYDPSSFTRFRKQIWEDLFTNDKYINTPFNSALEDANIAGGPTSRSPIRAIDRNYYYGDDLLRFQLW